ncbi:MAG: SBBP repeat-containing protein [Planctomycetota bacterium]
MSPGPETRGFALAICFGALLVGGAASACAELPELVYQQTLSQFDYATPHAIVADQDGRAYVLAARPGGNYATLVLKLDVDGTLVWSRWIDGDRHDIPGGIAVDPAGDVYVAGTPARATSRW